MSSRPSGEHPAVQAYHKKLDSIDFGVSAATGELDRKLSEYLADLKTPVPPKPDPEDEITLTELPVVLPPPLPIRR
jgi:hypothetical protein